MQFAQYKLSVPILCEKWIRSDSEDSEFEPVCVHVKGFFSHGYMSCTLGIFGPNKTVQRHTKSINGCFKGILPRVPLPIWPLVIFRYGLFWNPVLMWTSKDPTRLKNQHRGRRNCQHNASYVDNSHDKHPEPVWLWRHLPNWIFKTKWTKTLCVCLQWVLLTLEKRKLYFAPFI